MLLVGNVEGLIAVVDLNSGITNRLINDLKGASITSLDNIFDEDKKLTYWLATGHDRRVSVWCSKWSDNMCQLLDWLTFPAPNSIKENLPASNASPARCWNKYPGSIAQFAPAVANKPVDTLIYVGHGFKKELMFYNFLKKQITRTMSLTEWPVCMSVSPACNLIALGTRTRLLQLKDYHQATFQDYAQHSDTVVSICFSSDGKRLFSTAFNEIFIWDVNV